MMVKNERKVSVAEGRRGFTRLLREAREKGSPILIFNKREEELVAAILPPKEYARYARMRAYFEALALSQKLSGLGLEAEELVREGRKELEGKGEPAEGSGS
jgi:PHD/YefM family antitoxin component YafN of YafNO toxin-antitoxin module